MWYLRCRLTGRAVSRNYAYYPDAQLAIGASELLAIARNFGGEWRRWWPKSRRIGPLEVDLHHRCSLPGAEHIGLHWRCTACGKAYNRDHITPYPQCWFRAELMDAIWRDWKYDR